MFSIFNNSFLILHEIQIMNFGLLVRLLANL